jgi:tripartite-type tricarboxylate transporter receptor subunit TctC
LRDKFTAQGVEVDLKTPESFATMIGADIAKWAEVIKKANIKSE